MKHKPLILGIGVAALVLLAAGASAYVATNMQDDEPKAVKAASVKPAAGGGDKITWNEPRREVQPQQQQQAQQSGCNDANIVGTAIGAVAGGLAGNQIGKGKGNDLATIGGAIGGGYLGNQYIPTQNVLCP